MAANKASWKRVASVAILGIAAVLVYVWISKPDRSTAEDAARTTAPAGSSEQTARLETPQPESTVAGASINPSTSEASNPPVLSSTAPFVPVPTDTPIPPTATPDPCSLTLQQVIDAASPGEVLDLRACTYTQPASINKSLTLLGGTLQTTTSDRWAVSLDVRADNVEIDGWTFIGGGLVIALNANSNVSILHNTFREQIGNSIAMWGAVNGVLIEGNDIVNTKTRQGNVLFGRGSEGTNPCATVGRNVTIRKITAIRARVQRYI